MATRKVPVTSVTPASKVKATSKAQQARTRGLVMGIATATPVGRAAKVATTAVKASNAAKTAKATKTLATPKSAVKVKPAAKPVGNPVNQEKSLESMFSSASRGGLKTGGTLGKGRDHRVANSKQLKWEPNSRKVLDEISAMKKTKTVKINSALKQTADSTRATASRAAKKPAPANIPSRTPVNPARGTVKINSAKTVRVVKVAPKKK